MIPAGSMKKAMTIFSMEIAIKELSSVHSVDFLESIYTRKCFHNPKVDLKTLCKKRLQENDLGGLGVECLPNKRRNSAPAVQIPAWD